MTMTVTPVIDYEPPTGVPGCLRVARRPGARRRPRIRPAPEPAPLTPRQRDATAFAEIAPLVQERVTTLDDVPGYVDWLFLDQAVSAAQMIGIAVVLAVLAYVVVGDSRELRNP